MNKVLILIFCTILLSCANQPKFANTEWRYYFNQNDYSFIKFKDKLDYVEFDAEIGEHYYGTYRLNGDTIILHQERGEFDHEFEKGSHHRAGKTTFIMILKNKNQLGYIEQWENNQWVNNYYFSPKDSFPTK